MTVHLLDSHPGHHGRQQTPGPLRALIVRLLLEASKLLLSASKLLLVLAIKVRHANVPAREVSESARGLGSVEKTLVAGAAPAISEAGAVRDGRPHFFTSEIECEDCKREHDDDSGPDEDGLNRHRTPMSPDPAPVPFTVWQVPDGWEPRRPVNGRHLGTQPRRTLPTRPSRPGHPPWDTAAQPAIPPEPPSGPARPWDPGDGLEPPVPLARPYAPPAYGRAPQLDADEAQRLAEAMIP